MGTGAWANRATQWMDKWLTDEVGPHGEWIPEGSGYGYVSLDPMLSYAAAAERAAGGGGGTGGGDER